MEDMSIVTETEMESQSFRGKKSPDKKPSGDDPVSDWLLAKYYKLNDESMIGVKYGIMVVPLVLLVLFSLLVSNSTSNLIAFFAMLVSIVFIAISLWMLCWILDKDTGSRPMQDISDPIKEGSEGFFIT